MLAIISANPFHKEGAKVCFNCSSCSFLVGLRVIVRGSTLLSICLCPILRLSLTQHLVQVESTLNMQALAPKVKAIQERYKGDQVRGTSQVWVGSGSASHLCCRAGGDYQNWMKKEE
jgi:hypothetical protein